MAVGPDVVDVLVADHQQVDDLLARVVADTAAQRAEEADRLLSVCLAELARHLVVEEEYLYPTVREVLPEGEQLSSVGLSRTREAERVVKRLEGAAPPDREPLLSDLRHVLHEHVRETEAGLFPALRRACAPDQLAQLAGIVEMARSTAPTHVHPGLPHGTPWNQILAPGVGLFDKARDAVRGRPTRPDQV